jgi:hypothetical protein
MRPKTCSTCAHLTSEERCMLSGAYSIVERQYPTRCGIDFSGWVEREGIKQRIIKWFDCKEGEK